jgi:hypothetical protein
VAFGCTRVSAVVPRFGGIADQVTFRHSSQPLRHPAVLLRELAVARRVDQVVVPTLAMFGEVFVRLGGSVLTFRGSVQAVRCGSLGRPRELPQDCLFPRDQNRLTEKGG